MSKKETYLTYEDAGKAGYGSRATLNRRVQDGTLHAYRQGRRTVFAKSELERLVEPVPVAMSEDEAMRMLWQQIAKNAPLLSEERREELARLLRG